MVIKGGCDLFTTKPIGSDRKLFKTIDKHLDQIMEDNQLSQSLEQKFFASNSLSGASISPTSHEGVPLSQSRRASNFKNADRNGAHPFKFRRTSLPGSQNLNSNLSRSLKTDDSLGLQNDTLINDDDESPFGPLKNTTTRKTFAYLIAILNSTYPDHDFTNLQPTAENFHKINSAEDLIHKFNNIMVSLGKKEDLLNWIWDTVNAYMEFIPSKSYVSTPNSSRKNSMLQSSSSMPRRFSNSSARESPPVHANMHENCQIYEFQPSDQSILEDLNYPCQTMWSCYWFIYNKKKKRVSFIYLNALNKSHFSGLNNDLNMSSNEKGSGHSGTSRGKIDNFGGETLDDPDEVFMDDYADDDALDDDVIGDIEI